MSAGDRGRPWRDDYGYAARIGQPVDRPEYDTLASWTPRGSRVIDLGCGEGSLGARLIAERGCVVTGIDVDEAGVAQAHAKGLDARVGDVDGGIEAPDGAYDVAIMNVTLQMVYRPAFVMREILRVAPMALVSFPNCAWWAARVELLLGRFPRTPLYGRAWHETRHIHLFSWRDFLDLLAVAGGRVTAQQHFGRDSRTPSALAHAWPNLFARSCLARVERAPR